MLSDLLRCEVGCNQGHICKNIHFDTPFFILPTVLRDKDDSLRNFFPLKTFQTFSFCHIHLFISSLPLNGWARQPFIAERLGLGRGFIHRLYFTCLSALCIRFFKGHFYFPTIVGKVHHSCGAITIKGLKTTFLLKRTTFKEEKTGVIFGGLC